MTSERVQKLLVSIRETKRDFTDEEHAELSDELWREFGFEDDIEWEPGPEEIARRIADFESGAVEGIPWEQVRAELQEKLTAMHEEKPVKPVEELLNVALRLPREERRRMVEELRETLRDEEVAKGAQSEP